MLLDKISSGMCIIQLYLIYKHTHTHVYVLCIVCECVYEVIGVPLEFQNKAIKHAVQLKTNQRHTIGSACTQHKNNK